MNLRDLLYQYFIAISADAIFVTIAFIVKKYNLHIAKRKPYLSIYSSQLLCALWLLCNILVIATVHGKPFSSFIIAALLTITSIVLFLIIQRDLSQFSSVGIIGADRSVATGTDYKSSLQLCRNSLTFLGIGASKLTHEEEFEPAIKRCSITQPVRLLLLRPTNENLNKAAKQAHKPENEYKNTVTESLRRIASLKENRNYNIQVRFYREIEPKIHPIFRLLFIDQTICLVSFNVFGEGDGRHQPQMHVLFDPRSLRKIESFYYPFEQYFESLWDISEEWNFKDYLGA